MKDLKIKSLLVLFTVMLTIFATSCSQEGGKTSDVPENPDNVTGSASGDNTNMPTQVAVEEILEGDTMNFRQNTPPAFSNQFKQVVNHYLAMKNAFVNDNEAEVSDHAQMMLNALNKMPDNQLSGQALTYWKEKNNFLIEHLKLYQKAENMEQKRENFAFLSTVMVKSVQAFGYEGQKLYVDFCPMANDNRGAYWLSQTKEIQNPYMGQKMPNCGEVKKVI